MDKSGLARATVLKVTGGEYAGLAGDVVERTETGAVLHFAGNFNGEPIDKQVEIEIENIEFL